jgi:hypothetical protein
VDAQIVEGREGVVRRATGENERVEAHTREVRELVANDLAGCAELARVPEPLAQHASLGVGASIALGR